MCACPHTPQWAEQDAHTVAERVHAGSRHVRPEASILALAYSVNPSLPLAGVAGSRNTRQAIDEARSICDTRHEDCAASPFKRHVRHYVTIASEDVRRSTTPTWSSSPAVSVAAHIPRPPNTTHKRNRDASTTIPDAAHTPRTTIRRRCEETCTPVGVDIHSDIEYAADIQSAESWQEDGRIATNIDTDAAPRDTDNNTVFNVMLTDSTELISLRAWDAHTEEFVSMHQQLQRASEQIAVASWLRNALSSVSHMKAASGEIDPICCTTPLTEQVVTHIQSASLARPLRNRSLLAAALTLLQRDLEHQLWVVDFARLSATCYAFRDLTSEYLRLAAEHEELLATTTHEQAAEQELLKFIHKLEFHDPLRNFDDVLLNNDSGSDCSSD